MEFDMTGLRYRLATDAARRWCTASWPDVGRRSETTLDRLPTIEASRLACETDGST